MYNSIDLLAQAAEQEQRRPSIVISPPPRYASFDDVNLEAIKPHHVIINTSPVRRIIIRPENEDSAGVDNQMELIGRKLSNCRLVEADDGLQVIDQNQFRRALESDDVPSILIAVKHVRKFLCEDDVKSKTETVLSQNILPYLIKCLQNYSYPELQYEACWCITNMAAGKTSHTRILVDADVTSILVSLLAHSSCYNVKSQSAWALGNIAGDCEEFRNHVLEFEEVILLLLKLADDNFGDQVKKRSTMHIVIWTIANLCRWKRNWEMLEAAFPFLEKVILVSNEPELLSEASWAICRMFHIRSLRNSNNLSRNFVAKLVQLLGCDQINIITPVLRAITNIVAGEDDNFIQVFLDANILPELSKLLRHQTHHIRLEALLTLANISAGHPQQVQALIQHNLIQPVVDILQQSDNARLKKEACWVLGNATAYKEKSQIAAMVKCNLLPVMCEYLTTIIRDTATSWKAIQAIYNIFDSVDYGDESASENFKNQKQFLPAHIFNDTTNPYAETLKQKPNLLIKLFDHYNEVIKECEENSGGGYYSRSNSSSSLYKEEFGSDQSKPCREKINLMLRKTFDRWFSYEHREYNTERNIYSTSLNDEIMTTMTDLFGNTKI